MKLFTQGKPQTCMLLVANIGVKSLSTLILVKHTI